MIIFCALKAKNIFAYSLKFWLKIDQIQKPSHPSPYIASYLHSNNFYKKWGIFIKLWASDWSNANIHSSITKQYENLYQYYLIQIFDWVIGWWCSVISLVWPSPKSCKAGYKMHSNALTSVTRQCLVQ